MKKKKIDQNLEAIIARAPKEKEFGIIIFLAEPEIVKNWERKCYHNEEERLAEIEKLTNAYMPIKEEASAYFNENKMSYKFDDKKPSFVYLELTKSQVYQIAKQDFVRQVLAKPHQTI